jgi:hypothetical protein
MKLKDIQSRAAWARETIAQGMAGMRTRSALSAVLLSLAALGQAAAQISEAASQTNVTAMVQAPSLASSKSECVKVSIDITPFEFSRNYEIPFVELQELAKNTKTSDAYQIMGMVYTYRIVDVQTYNDANLCNIHKISVGYAPAKLLIASEITRNKCAFNKILSHEERHIKIYTDAIKKLEQDSIGPLLDSLRASIIGMAPEQANSHIKTFLHGRLDEVRRLHNEFDSLDKYDEADCERTRPRFAQRML